MLQPEMCRSSSIGTDSPFARSAVGSEVGRSDASCGEASGSQGVGGRRARQALARGKAARGTGRRAVSKSQKVDPDWAHRRFPARSGTR